MNIENISLNNLQKTYYTVYCHGINTLDISRIKSYIVQY